MAYSLDVHRSRWLVGSLVVGAVLVAVSQLIPHQSEATTSHVIATLPDREIHEIVVGQPSGHPLNFLRDMLLACGLGIGIGIPLGLALRARRSAR